jgi:DNA-binding response OmpR family regulator
MGHQIKEQAKLTDVMIADDDQDDFEILSEAIKELDLKVEISYAENGDILLKMIDSKIPDILFLDIVMPCRDGKSCIKSIRSNSKFDNMRILVYTSLRDTEVVSFCFRNGANLFINKPDFYGEIQGLIKKIFDDHRSNFLDFPSRLDFVVNP